MGAYMCVYVIVVAVYVHVHTVIMCVYVHVQHNTNCGFVHVHVILIVCKCNISGCICYYCMYVYM